MKNASMPKPGRRSTIFLTREQVLIFTRKLARGLAAGTPLLGCLRHMLEHEHSLMLREVENECIESIVAGQVFSEVLERHPGVFDSFFVTMVKAGERSGTLDAVLEELDAILEKDLRTKRQLVGAAVYPAAIVGLLAIGLAAWVLTTWDRAPHRRHTGHFYRNRAARDCRGVAGGGNAIWAPGRGPMETPDTTVLAL